MGKFCRVEKFLVQMTPDEPLKNKTRFVFKKLIQFGIGEQD